MPVVALQIERFKRVSQTELEMAMTGGGPAIDQLSLMLGSIQESLQNIKEAAERDRREANQHRSSVTNTVTAISEAQRLIMDAQTKWKEEWELEWEPALRKYKRERNESDGRKKLGEWLRNGWMVISGAVLAAIGYYFSHKL